MGQKMSHTIYAAKFKQMIIHQHVHLQRKSQSHALALAHVLIRLYPNDKSLVFYKAKEGRHVRINIKHTFVHIWTVVVSAILLKYTKETI